MNKRGPAQEFFIERGEPEPVFIAIVILGQPQAEFGVRGTATDKDFFVVHGNILHRENSLAAKAAHNKIDFIAGKQHFHGIGGIGNV